MGPFASCGPTVIHPSANPAKETFSSRIWTKQSTTRCCTIPFVPLATSCRAKSLTTSRAAPRDSALCTTRLRRLQKLRSKRSTERCSKTRLCMSASSSVSKIMKARWERRNSPTSLSRILTRAPPKTQFAKCLLLFEITSLALMKNEDNTSKGFAFINFADMDAAKKAVDAKNGEEFLGKPMFVGRAQKKSERMAELKDKFDKIKLERINKYQGVNLYVKNLDEGLDDETFTKEFAEHGQITSCKIMRDDKGAAKGFGFVCYTTAEEATKAVTEMNGKIIASKPIYVALAQRKEQRRQQLQNQMEQRVQQSRMQNAGPGGMPGMYPPQGPAVFYPMQQGGRGGNNMAYYQPQMGGQMGGQPRRFPQQGGKGQQFQTPQGYMVANQGGAPQRQNRQNRGRGKGDNRGAPAGGRGQAQPGKGGGRGGQQFQ